MSLVRIQGFSGGVPRISARLLKDNQAQVVENAKLLTGELRAWRVAKDEVSVRPDGIFVETDTAIGGTTDTIILAAATSNATDDFYNNNSIRIIGGTGVGQRRFFDDYEKNLVQAWQVEDTPLTFVDVTTVFKNATVNDVDPFPTTEAINDYFAIGFAIKRGKITIINGSPLGVGGVVAWEYWNGTAWAALAGVTDGTTSFTVAGTNDVTWTIPGDWVARILNASLTLFYIRARVTTVYTTNPKLSQGTIEGIGLMDKDLTTVLDGTSVYEIYDTIPEFLQTIYQFGKGTAEEHFLTWNKDVDVARSPVPGDTLERTYFTGLDQPRVTDNTIVNQSTEINFPQKSFFLGVPAPTTAPVLTVIGAPAGNPRDITYVYTFVNGYGEEGPRSPISVSTEVEDGEDVELRSMDQSPAADWNLVNWRIYRVAVGATGAAFQLVAEIAINTSNPQFTDLNPEDDSVLTDTLATDGFDPPPTDMKGIRALPNSIMMGFRENQVLLSEPFLPHAWPAKFRKNVDFKVVAVGNFGQTSVIGTTGTPYRLSGIDPSNMSLTQVHVDQPCVSKRGMVSSEIGVLYPSADGVMRIGPGINELMTIPLFAQDEWQALKPDTIHAAFHDGRYVAFFSTGLVNGELQGSGFMIDTRERGSIFTTLDFYRYAQFQQRENDSLYQARYINSTAKVDPTTIELWEGGGSKLSYKWLSKTFEVNSENFHAAKVEADYSGLLTQAEIDAINAQRAADIAANVVLLADPEKLDGPMNNQTMSDLAMFGDGLGIVTLPPGQPETVTFKLFATKKGEATPILRHTETVANDLPFRMPGGVRYHTVEIELAGKANVREVDVATSVSELQRRR